MRRFFTKVEHEKEVLGTLSVRVAYLDWNGEQIPWTEITSIAWQDQQIENTYRWTSGSKNLISPGINAIEFTTRRDKTYKGWYRLPNEQELLVLKETLKEAVKFHKLDFLLAKDLLRPQNYKEVQELKELVRKGPFS